MNEKTILISFRRTGLIEFAVLLLWMSTTCLAENPVIRNIYTADPAPHGNFGDGKLYLYADHDPDYPGGYGNMYDYHAYSTSNLIDWVDHGSVLNVTDFTWATGRAAAAWDGDCQKGPDGKYYYYAPIWPMDMIGVAVSDSPTGLFTDALGHPLISRTTAGIKNDNKCLVTANVFFYKDDPYLIFGQDTFYVVKLKRNMIELADEAVTVITKPENPYFWEGPWVDAYKGVFYMTCVVKNQKTGSHVAGTIDYATADNPYGPYTYKGVVMQRKGINEQMGIAHFKEKHYFFYHIDGPNGDGDHRLTCVEEFTYEANGDMPVIAQTAQGMGGKCTLKHDAFGRFEAEDYTSQSGTKQHAYNANGPIIGYVGDVKNGDWICFENFDFGQGAGGFTVQVASATEGGSLEFRIDRPDGATIGLCAVENTGGWTNWKTKTGSVGGAVGVHNLYLKFTGGSGFLLNVNQFSFQPTR